MIRRTRAQAVIIRDGRLLMVRHFDLTIGEHYWCLPGGGVEAGEHPEQAVVRELKEETGLDIRVRKWLRTDFFPEVSQGYNRAYTYLAEIAGGELTLGYDPEQAGWDEKFLQEVKWVPIEGELLHRLLPFVHSNTFCPEAGFRYKRP